MMILTMCNIILTFGKYALHHRILRAFLCVLDPVILSEVNISIEPSAGLETAKVVSGGH